MNRLPQRLAIPKDGNMEGVFKRLAPELLRHCGYEVDVLIKRVRKKRSGQQLKAVMGYWADIILEELGYERSDWLYIYGRLKIQCGWFTERVNKRTGEVVKVPRETHESETEEYSKFMELFQRNAAINHGINLPDPERIRATI